MFTIFGFYKFQKINDLKKNQKILSNLLNNKNINGIFEPIPFKTF